VSPVSVIDKDSGADRARQHIMCAQSTVKAAMPTVDQKNHSRLLVSTKCSWWNDLSVVVGEVQSKLSSRSTKGRHDANHQTEAENLLNTGRKNSCIAKSMAKSRIEHHMRDIVSYKFREV
jgi:hypothetical protein